MGNGFRIGRIFGIDIRIDWSWLLIFLLVIWSLSSTFGQLHPQWQPLLRWGIAVLSAVLFFASVLAHELAHSLVARTRGMPVRSITLFLFGGVSNIQREPESARAEFLMAIVGPLTSLAIGGILLVIASVALAAAGVGMGNPADMIGQLGPLMTIVLWLGSVNLILGIFNLVPGFPLDGGRVLRSLLWAITDDLRRATRWASWAGQGIAWLMIGSGIAMVFGVRIPFFGSGVVNGLWLAFIGWFLNSASARSYQRVVVRDLLDDVPVTRVMRSNPPTVRPDISVDTLVHDHIMGTDEQSFPVVDGGKLVGLVTLEDVRSASQDQWGSLSVRDIMTPAEQLVTMDADEDAAEAMDRLSGRDVRQLPVMREGQLAGMVRRRDLIRWLQLQSEASGSFEMRI